MFRSVCIAAASLALVGVQGTQLHLSEAKTEASAFNSRLRVCNAYSTADVLQVFVGIQETNNPVKYQSCEDYTDPLSSGVRITFRNDGMNVGAFAVKQAPSNADRLLLVVYNPDPESDDVQFKSHYYGSSLDAQVAMVDTSQEGADFVLTDGPQEEKLTSDEVLQLGEGAWQVTQKGTPKSLVSKTGFLFKGGEEYVVMRTGPGLSDVMVYPRVEVPFNGAGSHHMKAGAPKPAPKKEGMSLWMILGCLFLLLLLILLIIAMVVKSSQE